MKKLLVLLVFMLSFNCNNNDDNDIINCTTVFVYGLNITVLDSIINMPITENITVIATEGNYQETLMHIEGSNEFLGAGERSGNYIIEISADGYLDFISETVQVGADECHVIPEVIQFAITPN